VIHVWDSKTGHLVSAVTSGSGSAVFEIHWVAEKNLYLSVHEKEVRFWKIGVISLTQLQEIDAELKGLYQHGASSPHSTPRNAGYTPIAQQPTREQAENHIKQPQTEIIGKDAKLAAPKSNECDEDEDSESEDT
jgi:hypothetical protein